VKCEQNGANLFSNHPKQPIDCSITEHSAVPSSPRSSLSVIVVAVAVEAQSAMMKMQMAQSSPHLWLHYATGVQAFYCPQYAPDQIFQAYANNSVESMEAVDWLHHQNMFTLRRPTIEYFMYEKPIFP